jgi:hypothetical protein
MTYFWPLEFIETGQMSEAAESFEAMVAARVKPLSSHSNRLRGNQKQQEGNLLNHGDSRVSP